ncbi:hypothetical protein SAMN04488554_0547 [Ruania alba]|uniref:Nucleotidyl transferase AbiEii toxin, Type IV TA system n=2 Tax=Ruania alba TaxID=648782 RepID=A0A1H5D2J9_9MICO|nr:hypothetical protein SAMN04488554_0547 [Ruania alba]
MLNDEQAAGWHALLDLQSRHPSGWTLVGGQLVHLWCAARGSWPTRPTNDADAVLDVRGHPQALLEITSTLVDLGFTPDGTTRSGHQHRWIRGSATVDLLIPRYLGERAASRRGAGGATTIETPGAQKALNRTSTQAVLIDGRTGCVPRPSLVGAVVAKSAAHGVTLDTHRRRHLIDFAVLGTLIRPNDVRGEAPLDRTERRRVTTMVGEMTVNRPVWAMVDGAAAGLQRLQMSLLRDWH